MSSDDDILRLSYDMRDLEPTVRTGYMQPSYMEMRPLKKFKRLPDVDTDPSVVSVDDPSVSIGDYPRATAGAPRNERGYIIPENITPTDVPTVVDQMVAEAAMKGDHISRTLQDTGEVIGWTPPLGPKAALVQTGGDILYTLGAGSQVLQGVPGKIPETIGGLASIYSPFPGTRQGAVTVMKKAQQLVDKYPNITQEQAVALANQIYSQGVQEVGEFVGGIAADASPEAQLLRDYEAKLLEDFLEAE